MKNETAKKTVFDCKTPRKHFKMSITFEVRKMSKQAI